MTGFDIVDRYDIIGLLLLDVVLAVALVLGTPLWVAGLTMLVACIAVFARHVGAIMRL